MEPPARRGRVRRRRGFGVGSVLALVALVPLLGVGVVTWQSVQDAEETRAAANDAVELGNSAVRLTQLEGAVFDEVTWLAIAAVTTSFGLDPAVFGIEAEAGRAEAQRRTDELLASIGDSSIWFEVAQVREEGLSLAGLISVFDRVAGLIDDRVDDAVDGLGRAPIAATDAAELQDSIQVLQASIEVRRAVSDSLFGYFATVFDLGDPPRAEFAKMIKLRERYLSGLDRLEESAAADPRLSEALMRVRTEPAILEFDDTIGGFLDDSIGEGIPEVAPPFSVAAIVGNMDEFGSLYSIASRATELTAELLEVAWERVEAVVDEAVSAAATDERRVVAVAIALVIATGIAAVGATVLIVRPLRTLRRSADGLRGTEPGTSLAVGGPAEVRAAGDAIAEAAEHFDLLAEQTRALADGDLDASVLSSAAPGGSGAAVQRAVGRLRSALSAQDEFRRRLAHEASHDGLTKIPNRNASMAQLQRSLARTERSDTRLAVFFIDHDLFKDVNDRHGHAAGDLVLAKVASRLVTEVREGDHVGRLGGDEFVVIAEPIADVEEAVALAERLRASVAEPIVIGDRTVEVAASVGIALADGMALSADELLHDADLAVYRAKAEGYVGVVVCDEQLRRELAASADLSSALRRAMQHNEFVMHYQPIVGAIHHGVAALEALIRWHRDPGGPPVPPAQFIEFAERSDLIIELDGWVLDAVIREVATWTGAHRFARTPVSINVSGRHLAHEHFVRHVLDPLERHGVAADRIIIEVTESALLEDLPVAGAKLETLRQRGVRVAIDDFGTGYTSLAHLRALPIDTIKIDRSFIIDESPDGASLLKLIIDTGHLLGASVTAEGVETSLEVDRLEHLGSDALQGYFFARPAPVATLPALVASADTTNRVAAGT